MWHVHGSVLLLVKHRSAPVSGLWADLDVGAGVEKVLQDFGHWEGSEKQAQGLEVLPTICQLLLANPYSLKQPRKDMLARVAGDGGGREACVWAALVLADGTMATGDASGAVQLWDASLGTRLAAFRAHAADVLALAASPAGDVLFAAGVDPSLAAFQRVPPQKGASPLAIAHIYHAPRGVPARAAPEGCAPYSWLFNRAF